jgi:tetratricopeptide (TPR) repeat protein
MKKPLITILFLIICLANAYTQKESNFLRGVAFQQQDNELLAIEHFSEAILNYQAIKKSYFYRGISYYKLGNFSKAEMDFHAAENNESLFWIARIQAKNNNPALCIETLKTYLITEPGKSAEVFSDPEFQSIHYSNEWQNMVMNHTFTIEQSLIKLAQRLSKQNNYSEAISLLSDEIEVSPDNAFLIAARAQLYLDNGNFELAVYDYRKADEIKPESVEILKGLAKTSLLKKNYPEAANAFTKLLQLKPESFSTYLKLSKTELLNGNHQKAKQVIDEYLLYFPVDTAAVFLSAQIDYQTGKYKSSLLQLNSLLAKEHKQPEWYLLRGECYLETGLNKYAAEDLSMYLDLDPYHPEANLKLGIAMYRSGHISRACYYWKRANRAGNKNAARLLLQHCQ